MPVVLNEKKQAEYIIEKGEVGNKPTSTLFLLAKYYRQKENLNKEQTFNKLNEFMGKNYKNYNSATWEDIIEDISKKANKYPLREIDHIEITKSEIDMIRSVCDIKYEKLLFTMLCYAKLYNKISDKNNGWVNTNIKELFRVARVSVRYRNDKFLYLNDLETAGLISFSNKNDNLNLRVTFIDDDSETILRVDDFRELGYEYLNHIGDGKFIRCKCCKMLVKKKSNNDRSTKYCNNCAKEVQNKQKYETCRCSYYFRTIQRSWLYPFQRNYELGR